jgi:hypothetical protein
MEDIEDVEDADAPSPDDVDKRKTKKKMNKDTDVVQLRRPIIFICNDMNDKVLMPLRDLALAIKIEESSPDKLISRLRHICK